MVTEKMIEAAAKADADYAGRTFGALSGADKTRFRERAKLMLEAALSTDAEPVEPICNLVWKQYLRAADDVEDYFEVARPGDKCVDGSDPFPVYAAPQQPPPSVAVKADRIAMAKAMCERDGFKWDAESHQETGNGETPEQQREYWMDKADAAISALSAQVQDVAVDGADIGRCIHKLSTENPIKWAEAEKKPILRGWFVGQVMKHFDGKPDEKIVRELVDTVFAVYPAAPAAKQEGK